MNSREPDYLRGTHWQPLRSTCIAHAIGPPLCGILGLVALGAGAQESGARPTLTFTPELFIQETLTNNSHLTSGNGKTELITELTPELRLGSNAGRIKGFLDYAVRGLVYARESSANNIQQILSAAGTAEAVENWAYVDASATISQQNISALGTQSPDSSLINSNRTEVTSVNVAPYLRGHLGNFADYDARLIWQSTRSDASNADSTTTTAMLRLASDRSLARLGWSADLSHQAIEFRAAGTNQTDRANGGLTYAATPELRFSAKAGHEINDLVTVTKKGYNTHGWGVTWSPSERTRLDAEREKRFFGNSHSVRFEHRMPRSVWTYTDTRDVSTDAGTSAPAGTTVFDLLFTQAASLVPDPVQRAAYVDAFLASNGLTRASLITGGFLTSAASVQRHQDLSFATLGVRTTLIVSAFRNDARRLDSTAVVTDDLSNGNLLNQKGLSVNVSHQLTPLSALSVLASLTKTGASLGLQGSDLKLLTTTLTSRVRQNADLSLSARHAVSSGTASSYTESAVLASLRLRF